MAPSSSAEVRAVVDPVVRAAGLDLEDLAVVPAGRRRVVRVTVDGDDPPDLDAVAEVSRAVSDALDAADAFGSAPYTLEVGTPGVGRPLTAPRHWRRALRRLVAAELVDGTPLTGRLVEADSAAVRLDVGGTVHEVAYADVRSARVEVEFARPAAAGAGVGDEDGHDDDEGDDDVSQDLPETGPGSYPANEPTGPEVDEMAGRGDDEQITDLVEEDPDTTDPDAAPASDEVGTGSERSGADVIGLDDDTAEDDPVELVVGPGTSDDGDMPVEDDLTDGNDDDGADQVPVYRDDDDDPSDLTADAAREAADEGPVEGSQRESGPTAGDPRAL